MISWRYIPQGPLPASFNMAADAWLLNHAGEPASEPVLRFYAWEQPSITIGYHQEISRAVNIDDLGKTPVVRRITGGRALLHEKQEITYSLSGDFRRHKELGDTLQDRYRAIAEAIVAFYRSNGWEARISHRDAPVSLGKNTTVRKGCFAAVSQYELLVGRTKMAAGSQRYTRHAFIQHGAIKIGPPGNHPAIINPIGAQGIDTNMALSGTGETHYEVLASAFSRRFGVRLDEKPFSPSELRDIADIENGYGNLNNA